MKIVNMLGGLGNQMFVYAMFLALKYMHPEEDVRLCKRSYKGYPLHNGYELDRIFGLHAQEPTTAQLCRVAYPFFNYRSWQIMRHWLPVRKKTMTRGAINIPFDYSLVTKVGDTFYDGYWQNEANFKNIRDIVLEAYSFPPFADERNQQLASKIISTRSVSCHIRRGDYLQDPKMCVCTPDYYASAIKRMNNLVDPEIYCIFSDDIQWCRDNLVDIIGNKEIIFVDWNKGTESYRDMQLMSVCKYNIIANSSFSWWGAWLNNNVDKVVIAPKTWKLAEITNDPICDSWLKISSV